jgi:hypothetical protein
MPNADEAVKAHLFALVLAGADNRGASERLQALEDAYFVQGTLTKERYEALSASLRRMTDTSALDAFLKGVERTQEALQAHWDQLGLAERKLFISLVLSKVIVRPALKVGMGSKAKDRLDFQTR